LKVSEESLSALASAASGAFLANSGDEAQAARTKQNEKAEQIFEHRMS
jgi:hypothetical protein